MYKMHGCVCTLCSSGFSSELFVFQEQYFFLSLFFCMTCVLSPVTPDVYVYHRYLDSEKNIWWMDRVNANHTSERGTHTNCNKFVFFVSNLLPSAIIIPTFSHSSSTHNLWASCVCTFIATIFILIILFLSKKVACYHRSCWWWDITQ